MYAIGGSADPTIFSEGNYFIASSAKQVARVVNCFYNSQTWHKVMELWIRVEGIYIILYSYLHIIRIWHATFKADNFLHKLQIQHKISKLELKSLTRLIK